MNLKKNYYQVLGIEHNSDTGTIKKAYYKLSKQHHPDKGGDAKIFNEINEAYEILTNEETRTDYDKKSRFGANYDELYEMLTYEFDNLAKAWKEDAYQSFVKKEVLNVVVRVDDDFDGRIEYERWMICKSCEGTGKDINSKIVIRDEKGAIIKTFDGEDGCDFCEGTGEGWNGQKCGFCFGQGKVGAQDCQTCNGEKRYLSKQKVKGISFPEGSDEVKIELMGNFSKDQPGKVGHLWVVRKEKSQSND